MTDPAPNATEAPPARRLAGPETRPDRALGDGRIAVWRHPAVIRITHWINVAAVVVLLMSGINILMAHPHLYWGLKSTFADPWLSVPRAPGFVMLPSYRNLAEARNWHFFFAWVFVLNGLVYLVWGAVTGRFQRRFWPTRADRAGFWTSVKDHALLRFAHDDEARAYNVIQKLTYLAMVWIVLPLMLVTGLSMSPGFNAIGGLLLELMGGRQSARTLHFISAGLIVGFIIIHVGLVIWTGLINNMRAMVTGWFVIRPSPGPAAPGEDPL